MARPQADVGAIREGDRVGDTPSAVAVDFAVGFFYLVELDRAKPDCKGSYRFISVAERPLATYLPQSACRLYPVIYDYHVRLPRRVSHDRPDGKDAGGHGDSEREYQRCDEKAHQADMIPRWRGGRWTQAE